MPPPAPAPPLLPEDDGDVEAFRFFLTREIASVMFADLPALPLPLALDADVGVRFLAAAAVVAAAAAAAAAVDLAIRDQEQA